MDDGANEVDVETPNAGEAFNGALLFPKPDRVSPKPDEVSPKPDGAFENGVLVVVGAAAAVPKP